MNIKRQNKETVQQEDADGYDMDLLSDYLKELTKPENLIGPFETTEELMASLWDDDDE